MSRRQTLTGLGIGLAAAGITTAAGLAADRLRRARNTALALDSPDETYEQVPDAVLVVAADDGVVLHVEIDEPARTPADLPEGATAPTVVMTHGFCLSLRCWVFQRRTLKAAGYRVVSWDQRGHGKSGTGDSEFYTIDQLGRDLGRVLAEAAPEGPLVLVGHSMGGMTAMALAVDHHELITARVVGVAFLSTSPGGLSGMSWGLGRVMTGVARRIGPLAMGQLAARQDLIDSALGATTDLQNLLVDRYSFASPVPMGVVELTRQMIFATRLEVMHGYVPGFDAHDKHEALEQFVGVETLVLNGADDVLTPPDHSDEIVRRIPGAEHLLVADAGHVIMLEHPDLVSDQLLQLLSRATRAAVDPTAQGDRTKPARVRRTLTDLTQRRRVDDAVAKADRGRAS